MSGVTEDDDILAAEFALGLLDEADAAAVQARARTDGPLSLRIAWWRDQLAPLAREVETPAPVGLWSKIEAQLPGNDNSLTLIQRWRAAAVAATSIAAALLGYIILQPAPAPAPVIVAAQPAAQVPLSATLEGLNGLKIPVRYDDANGSLKINAARLEIARGDAELWLIPQGLRPISLGIVNAKNDGAYFVPDHLRKLVSAGALLAITNEAKGGSRTGEAQGPIMAAGKIIRT
jgi:anti-sigma-K factor RskA